MASASRVETYSAVFMDTVVSIRVVDARPVKELEEFVERAFGWFYYVEETCSRFDERSELSRLSNCVGTPVTVSDLLFQVLEFSLTVAGLTDGAFDPTIGRVVEAWGFDQNYLTGKRVRSGASVRGVKPTYKDVMLDPERSEVTLLKPLRLDLGSVGKGLAIDLATRELDEMSDFFVEAGGDVYVKGRNEFSRPWRVGIRHPRMDGEFLDTLHLSDLAVCTSGDYERMNAEGGHHLIDPRSGMARKDVASVTVIAPNAMLANALSTAAFICGARRGVDLLEQQGVEGMIVTSRMARHATPRFGSYMREQAA